MLSSLPYVSAATSAVEAAAGAGRNVELNAER